MMELSENPQYVQMKPKGRRMPLKEVAEFFEFGSPKINKESKLWVKTKEPVLVCLTNGKIEKSYGDTADA